MPLRRHSRRWQHVGHRRREFTPGHGHLEAGQSQYTVVGTLVPAHRHPGQGDRAPTPTSRTCASRACSTPGACGRAVPVRTRSRTTRRSASTRPRSRTSRAPRSSRSATSSRSIAPQEYDAIQAAAQLKVQWQTAQGFPQALGQLLVVAARGRRHQHAQPGRATRRQPATSPRLLATAAHTVSATYKYHYNSFVPIGPHCCGRRRRTARQSAIDLRPGAGARPACPRSSVTAHASNAASRRRRCRRRTFASSGTRARASFGGGQTGEVSRGGGDHLDQARQAGARAVDALGPDRLGPLGHGAHVRRHDGHRRQRQPARRRLDQLRPVARRNDRRGRSGCSAWPRGRPTPATRRHLAVGHGGLQHGGLHGGERTSTSGRVLSKTQPLYGGSLKGNSLRAPSAPQTYFASEQIVDELAHAEQDGPDRVPASRTSTDLDQSSRSDLGARWLSVLDAATQQAGWNGRGSPEPQPDRHDPHGPRLRLRHLRVEPGRHGRRRRGEHEDRARSRPSTSRSRRTTGSRSARSSSPTR